jgi:hypothetical protein
MRETRTTKSPAVHEPHEANVPFSSFSTYRCHIYLREQFAAEFITRS